MEQPSPDQATSDTPASDRVQHLARNAALDGQAARQPQGDHHGQGREDAVPAELMDPTGRSPDQKQTSASLRITKWDNRAPG